MSYKGPENPKEKLTEILDPKLLVDLSADILFSLGCTNTKKMDGPGDGGRDLYAENQSGEKLLGKVRISHMAREHLLVTH